MNSYATTPLHQGLTPEEARARLASGGFNELPRARRRSAVRIVFEAETEEEGVMRRPPRPPAEPLFSAPTILWSLVQGLLVLGVTATIFVSSPQYGLAPDQVRGLTFAALVFCIMALILVDRSSSSSIITAVSRPNRALAAVVPIVAVLLSVALFWQPARDLFGFGALEPRLLAVPPLTGLIVLLVLEALKPVWRHAVQTPASPHGSMPNRRHT